MRIILLFFFIPAVLAEFGINKKCVTPHGAIGTCKEVTSCHLYRSYKHRLKNVSVKKYLSMSYCGERYNRTLVCCGPENFNIFEECGLMEDSVPKIFGGEITETHFPWMVALQYRENNENIFRCQGFLINQHFVLTAAHCVKGHKVHAVILGVSNLTNYEQQTFYRRAQVLNITYHPDYVSDIDDIGLIRIDPVKYTDRIRWICLPKKNSPSPSWFTIRGWGKNDKKLREFSSAIQSRIRFASHSDCRLVQSKNLPWSRVVCAGGEPNKDSCEGDSGGALMNETAEFGWTAFGIVSFGSKNCSRGDPGVYTRIQYYLEWLDRKMLEMLKVD